MAGSFGVENGLISAVLNGAGTLTKDTVGTVTLSGANTMTGAMDIVAGTLAIGGAGLLTSGSVTMSGAAVLTLGATAQTVGAFRLVDGTVQDGSLMAGSFGVENGLISAVLNGAATLMKDTAGTVTLGGANKMTGAMDIVAGTLAIDGAGLLTSGSLTVSGAATVLTLGATAQTVGAFRLVDGTVQDGSLTAGSFGVENGLISAVLNGVATLMKDTAGTVTLSGANRLTGGMEITAGTLAIGGAGLLASGGLRVQGEGTVLELGATSQTVGPVTLAGGAIQGGRLTGSEYALQAGTVSAVLDGTAALTKSSAGLVVLAGGSNTFSGATFVDAGTLSLAGTGVKLSSTLVEIRGGHLQIAANEQINDNAAVVLSSGSLSFSLQGLRETVKSLQVTGGDLIVAGTLEGTGNTIRLEGGNTTVAEGGILRDHHIVLNGGVNTVQAGGMLQVQAGSLGLELVGRDSVLLTLNGGLNPGSLMVSNSISLDATLGSGTIRSASGTGEGLSAGQVNLGGGVRSLTVLGSAAGALTLEATVLNGGLTKLGAGALVLKGMTTMDLGLDLREGTLELGHADALMRSSGSLTFSGGTLKYGAGINSDISGVLAPVAAGQVARIDTNGQAVVFENALGGFGALEKKGSGSLTLNGASTYSAGTVINAGSLVLGRDDALYTSGAVAVNSGATLDLGTTIQNVGRMTIDGGVVTGGSLISPLIEVVSSGRLNSQLLNGGSLLLTGAGTLVVASRSDAFYGTTVIGESATLQLGVGAGIASLGRGTMVNDGVIAFQFASGTTVEFANNLSGAGSVMYLPSVGEGARYLVRFTGVNTSTGGTTVGAGVVLDLSNDSLLGSGTAGLTLNGGTVQLPSGADVTIKADRTLKINSAGATFDLGASQLDVAAKITGTGGITKAGSGVMTLSNDNTYTGQNTVNNGVLQVGNGGDTGSLGLGTSVSLNSPTAQLVINRGKDLTISQSLSGSGTFSSQSSATIKITGDLSGFSGQIKVQAGTLQVSNSGVLGLGTGPLTNNAVLSIERKGALDIPGMINGQGKLNIDGSSAETVAERLVVTLNAKSTFTGDTELTKGTLILGGTSSIGKSAVLKIQSGGLLDVSAFNDKGGYVIPAGQKLMGDGGQVRGTLQIAGALAPGNSPGTISLGGLTALAGSDYVAEFRQTDGKFDQIIIDKNLGGTGIANLSTISAPGTPGAVGNTVIATAVSRTVESKTYAIITGGTVNGTFEAVTGEFFRGWVDNDPSLRSELQERAPLMFGGTLSPSGPTAVLIPHLHYTASEVLMEVERKTFRSFGLGINAQEIGGYLDSIVGAPGDLLALEVQLEAYKLAQQVTAAIAGAGVSPYADLMTISRRRMLDLTAGVGSRLDLLGLQAASNGGVESIIGSGETGWSVWQSTSVSQLNRQAVAADGFGGFNSSGQSSVMGLEKPFGAGRIGLVGAVGSTSANFSLPSTTIKSDSWHLGTYVSLPVAPFFADVAFIYGRVDNDARRNIEMPGYTTRTRALFSSDEYTLRIGGGLQVMPAQSAWEITPTEHLLYVGGMQAALEETGGGVLSQGGGLGARVKGAKMSGLLNEVGLTVGRRWVVRGTPVSVRLQANWLHDFDGTGSVQASFVGAPVSAGGFTARNASGDKDALKISTTVEVSLTQRLSLRIGGEYERRKSSTKSSLTISIGMEF